MTKFFVCNEAEFCFIPNIVPTLFPRAGFAIVDDQWARDLYEIKWFINKHGYIQTSETAKELHSLPSTFLHRCIYHWHWKEQKLLNPESESIQSLDLDPPQLHFRDGNKLNCTIQNLTPTKPKKGKSPAQIKQETEFLEEISSLLE